jgi:hypothetical protein
VERRPPVIAVRSGRRTAAVLAVLATVVLALTAYSFRGPILDRYRLSRLERATGDEREKLIAVLEERRSPAVAPYVMESIRKRMKGTNWVGFEELREEWATRAAALGPGAVPYLIDAMLAPLPERPFDALAVEGLGALGDAALPAVPHLLRFLEKSRTDDRTLLEALSKIDPEQAIPIILADSGFDGNDSNRFRYLTRCLALMGPRARPAVPRLLDALCRIEGKDEAGKPMIDDSACAYAADALDEIDPEAALERALALLHDPAEWKRLAGIVALGRLQSRSERAVPTLLDALASSRGREEIFAITAGLRIHGRNARIAARPVAALLRSLPAEELQDRDDGFLGEHLCSVLQEIGDASREVLDVLTAAVATWEKPDPPVACLMALAEDGEEPFFALLRGLARREAARREEVIEHVRSYHDDTVLPLLRAAAARGDEEVRSAAALIPSVGTR